MKRNVKVVIKSSVASGKASVKQVNTNKRVSLCDRKLYSSDKGMLRYNIVMGTNVYGD